MPLYMIQFSYSSETWAGWIKTKENREEAVRGMLEQRGCKLHNLWYAFGESDGFALLEAPSNVSAAGVAIAITSTGAFRSFKTSVLMTQDEAIEALGEAAQLEYAPPGQAVHA